MSVESYRYEKLIPLYAQAEAESAARELLHPLDELSAGIDYHQSNQSMSFSEAILWDPDVSAIAEHKRKSPSKGGIKPDSNVAWAVRQYEKGGATALSILTHSAGFGGKIDDLSVAKVSSQLPILRKDFISTKYQLNEARSRGAAAALLIVGGLQQNQLESLHEEAQHIGLESLVEVHNEEEMRRAIDIGAKIIGINNRDLVTFEENTDTAKNLRELIPDGVVCVAESAYKMSRPQDIRDLRDLKFDAVLMGTDLMLSDNPSEDLRNWLATDK